ncbi:hypothetical protein CR513_21477, partial [Mucuna pruriens]
MATLLTAATPSVTVSVANSPTARSVAALGEVQGFTLRRVAVDRRIGRGQNRVENRVGLLVAFGAWRALDPTDVASCVEHHVGLTRWLSDSDSEEVLAASLTRSRDDWALERVGFELVV